jgi:hypothetical protein
MIVRSFLLLSLLIASAAFAACRTQPSAPTAVPATAAVPDPVSSVEPSLRREKAEATPPAATATPEPAGERLPVEAGWTMSAWLLPGEAEAAVAVDLQGLPTVLAALETLSSALQAEPRLMVGAVADARAGALLLGVQARDRRTACHSSTSAVSPASWHSAARIPR